MPPTPGSSSSRPRATDRPAGRGGLTAATGSPDALGALALLLSRVAGRADAPPEFTFHQGTVVAWDVETGTNVINVLGNLVPDVPVLTTGDNILLSVGQRVGVLRYRTSYFVLGRVTSPGVGNAFAWSFDEVITTESTTSTTFTDLATVGPTLTVDVGSSRTLLVFMSAEFDVDSLAGADVGLRVDGPSSSWLPNPELRTINNDTTVNTYAPYSTFLLLTSDPGRGDLHTGPHTLTLKYRVLGAAETAAFTRRRLLVIPF